MAASIFQVLDIHSKETTRRLQYILHIESGLKIFIYPLQIFPAFEPSEGEMHFFGKVMRWWFVFETWDIRNHQQEFISQALQWFAEYRQFPEMQLTLDDPRKADANIIVS